MRILNKEIINNEGKEVELAGWVSSRRDHGKLVFIDLRDMSGVSQVVFLPNNKDVYENAQKLRSEWVVKIIGMVKKRPGGMENKEIGTGGHEIEATSMEILNESQTPPIEVVSGGMEIGEEIRMKYRYLDLRRPRMAKNIRNRDKIVQFFRKFLGENDFIEVETPILTKSTPEGARDYLVPSRIYPGRFYALPQSPQQYKQLLMAAGFEKYFQVARCFRDEDTRGDRQPEFTQLDLEMSFVNREDVMELMEKMLIETVQKLYPNKKIQEIPFPKMSYKEAMEKYKTDRPDIRKDKNNPDLLAFCWVIDFPFFERVKDERNPELVEGLASASGSTGSPQTSDEVWTFTHNPFSAPKPEFMDDLMNKANIENILTTQYDIVLNGYEVGGGSIRNHQSKALKKVFEIMGFEEERIKSNFGHMLEAFDYGAPPHGGIAPGIDRLVMILENEPNIREVIAFPKSGDGFDPMMSSPSEVDGKQLKELKLKIEK